MAGKVRTDLVIDDEGGMEHEGDDRVSKSCKLEKRQMHKQKQRVKFSANLKSYEDLKARIYGTQCHGILDKGTFR